jgi:hypothetical protein
MKNTLIFIILLFAFGCKNVEQKNDNSESNNKHTLIKPKSEFFELVKEIESKNWVSDTSRINNIGLYNLKGLKVHIFNNYPFYNITYENSQVGHVINGDDEKEIESKSILSKTKQIWAYYYRKKNETNFIFDGVIELWSYNDSTSAQMAYKELQIHGDYIFFNTTPYFHLIHNDIYIFHTRASAFSVEQRSIYETFVENNKK